MNSDKSDDDSEFQTISKQIIDYYNRYAQNKDLLKYCLGSSVSYIPPIVKDDEFDNPEPTEDIAEEPAKVSPTSSVASNRKLEWDNGADIGYGNCTNLQKSISLPTVFTEENKKKTDSTQKKQLSRLPPTVGSHSTKASSSFSSPDIKQANIYSSSSLSGIKCLQFIKKLNFACKVDQWSNETIPLILFRKVRSESFAFLLIKYHRP